MPHRTIVFLDIMCWSTVFHSDLLVESGLEKHGVFKLDDVAVAGEL